jgi:hypothetical protein
MIHHPVFYLKQDDGYVQEVTNLFKNRKMDNVQNVNNCINIHRHIILDLKCKFTLTIKKYLGETTIKSYTN